MDLSARSLGEFILEDNDPRVLIRSRVNLNVVLDLFLELFSSFRSFNEDNGCLYDLAADLVRCCGYAALKNVGKLHDNALDLEGSDTVSGRLDNVVNTSYIPEETILISPCRITCVIPAVVPC